MLRSPLWHRTGDRHRCRWGFSLIELLVVIAVAMLLTALTLPAMRQVHENAQRVACMANLQQLGHAFIMFGDDHNDALPTSQRASESRNAPEPHDVAPDRLDRMTRGTALDDCSRSITARRRGASTARATTATIPLSDTPGSGTTPSPRSPSSPITTTPATSTGQRPPAGATCSTATTLFSPPTACGPRVTSTTS